MKVSKNRFYKVGEVRGGAYEIINRHDRGGSGSSGNGYHIEKAGLVFWRPIPVFVPVLRKK